MFHKSFVSYLTLRSNSDFMILAAWMSAIIILYCVMFVFRIMLTVSFDYLDSHY